MINGNISSSILIIDDDPEVSQLIHCILSDENYNVDIADNANEAIKTKELKTYDLILLDVNMPGISGFDFCNLLKESYETKDIPIIFITGNCLPEDKVKGFDNGAIDYITKPFNISELLARVRTHLELKHSKDLLKEMALMDGLTKLYNHTYIHERLSEAVSSSKRHKEDLSLVMFDLDNFKLVNDTYGHKFGDHVLLKVSSSIRDIIREEDIAGRYGGEEFIIILPSTDKDAAQNVAEKIRTSVKVINWGIKDFQVTLSGGVHTLVEETVNEFIEATDILLYKAKNTGRDRVIASLPNMNKIS
ncbi:MAG: diguanylate cyclase [Spirochaetaceae bacterium]|nr:diguanylate cyclase [Spirochaetaceae bacterium]